MAPQKLTEYERQRLENIKRNGEMLASFKIHSKVNELSAATKRQRVQNKSYKVSPAKKPKTETPIVIRRSLRTRGMPPDSSTAGGLKDDFDFKETPNKTLKSQTTPKKSSRELGPLSMKDAYRGTTSDRTLIETILGVSKKSQLCYGDNLVKGIDEGSRDWIMGLPENEKLGYPIRVSSSIDLESLELEEESIARVVPGRIFSVRFFPSADMKMVVVGNKFGDVGLWNVDSSEEDGDGIYLYSPHSGPVSGIAIQPFSLSKMFTSCYDGFIRLMDVEKEKFDLLYSCDNAIFSISHQPNDVNSLYFSEGHGGLGIWDARAGKSLTLWNLHEKKINTTDFNPENTNIMATSSSDGTACIWDLRNIDADKPKPLKTIGHKRSVQSAYFSPSGSSLATTSFDDKVGLISGANYEDISMIYHNNQTGRWISSFRAIWGWDDSYIYIGSMKRGVDVISAAQRNIVATLESPHVSAIQCRFDAHPYKVGMLAGATSGGQVYVWSSC
ncbi:uncharacterized protein LOC132277514 [Cornus florida]|uniref:uncharacterized protein LOC132277514 n=1 Tax=Cornus florida TaxID=4283 RepID=UPI0028986B2F|nr:uncharacterized protein LOC132277514 [Cornus florida]